MKKRCVFVLSILVPAALIAYVPAGVAGTPAPPSAAIPGAVCLTHNVVQSNGPMVSVGTSWTDSVIFDPEGNGRFRVTSLAQNWPFTGVTTFCSGFAQVAPGSPEQLVSTMTCSVDGSQLPYSGTGENLGDNPFWISSAYHFTLTYENGKIMLPGYFWSDYNYAVPGLFSDGSSPNENGSYGPFSYYGTYSGNFKCPAGTP